MASQSESPSPCNSPERRRSPRRPPRTNPKSIHKVLRDDRSSDGASAHTPSSVQVDGDIPQLTRDLSDLSGSYVAKGAMPSKSTVVSRSSTVPMDDQSLTSHQRPWTHAKILSAREPTHPQPPTDCDDSVGVPRKPILMMENGDVEVVEETEQLYSPLIVLLMDPGKKLYELMQLWVDPQNDSVRDALHAIQHSLIDKKRWKQDYDGLFQVRNNHFSQLIHILNISKYEVQPYELWVAKPWAWSAKATVGYASELLNCLKGVEVLRYASVRENPRWKFANSKLEDSILVLTQDAKQRIYVPGGISKTHHAHQFLSFSPPFDTSSTRIDVSILAVNSDNADEVCSQLSDSHCGISVDSAGIKSRTSLNNNKNRLPVSKTSGRSKLSSSATTAGLHSSDNSAVIFRPYPHKPRSRSRVVQAISLLNCSSCKNDVFEGSRPLDASDTLDSTLGPLWQVWEEGSMASKSIISESAPLLIAHPASQPDWIAEF